MRKFTISFFFILIFALTFKTNAQLSGSYNVGFGQTYTNLTRSGGFFDAVNSQGLSGNVIVNISSDLTNENGANGLNQWTEFGTGGYTITIRPMAAIELLIEGGVNDAMIRLNGADRVTIDGRFNGSGKYLRFRNTNSNNPTFSFLNDASNNTITYCFIESGNANTNNMASIGAILFGTTTGSLGNDNNTISYCDIRDRSDASANPAYMIYSYGTATTTTSCNSGNQILNNNIYNFWKNGSYCGAINLSIGTGDNWVISGNSFFQTVINISTSNSSGGWNVIFLNYTGINNCTVSGNYIGGSAPNCGGTPWTTSTAGNGSLQFPGIRAGAVGSILPSSIQGNTIANLNFATRTSNGAFPFVGILVESGVVNVGDVTGNTIGSATGTGNISISFTNNGFYTVYARGIDHRATGNVQNNTVGSITISSSSNNSVVLELLSYVSAPASNVTISNNLIGSTSTPNSIQHAATAFNVYMRGIISTILGANVTLNGNTVANLTNYSSGTASINYAIINTGSGTAAITNNTIHDLNSPLTNTTYIGTLGIGNTSSGTSQLFQGNTIYSLNNTSVAASNNGVVGLHVEGPSGSGTITRNRVYGLSNTSTGNAPFIFGLNAFWGSWTASNNQITLTNGAAADNVTLNPPREITARNTNRVFNTARITKTDVQLQTSPNMLPAENDMSVLGPVKNISDEIDAANGVIIQGIHDESDGVWNFYYNSVYIGGSASSGNMNSYCYARQNFGPSTVTFGNNLFFNARTGGTGNHYAIANEFGGATGWPATASNYNVFVSSNANTIGEWNTGTNCTINQWRTSSGGDKQSWSVTSAQINAANLFNSISGGNLNIQSGNAEAWLVSGKGIAVSGQNSDYAGASRVTAITGGTTDIGSDEFTATPPACPLASIDNVPGSGVTSNFTLYGRIIVTINWGTGGTSYPSLMNVQYYSGVNPPGVIGGNYSNSYWAINIGSGSLSGAAYDITINFGDNETYTITVPSSNTLLAKSNGTWEVFPAGSGAWQTQLNWANLSARTNGLTGFSNFALTDATAPLPVIISYFGASVKERNTELKWITEIEINNKGFAVQRREAVKENYSDWKEVGFVNGKGNTNNQTVYTYTDAKMFTGKYQYRLKQIDYNGNSEYYNLQNPSEVVIGVPSSVGISQNYPNPSNPYSLIDYQITFTGKVKLIVYDITGREVQTLINEYREPGYYTAQFDGTSLSSGVYIYRLIAEGEGQKFVKSNKLVLVK